MIGEGSDCAVFAVVVAVVQDATKVGFDAVFAVVDVEVVVAGVHDHLDKTMVAHLCLKLFLKTII